VTAQAGGLITTGRGLKFSPAPSQVVPGLSQGAMAWSDTRRAASSGEYDLVVFCAREVDPPPLPPGVAKYTLRLDDEPELKSEEFVSALKAAYLVQTARRRGKQVLVACAMGLNRSGLVTGLSLRLAGLSGIQAVHAVKAARGEFALCNPLYRRIVMEYRPT
jgi:hypothetical protein